MKTAGKLFLLLLVFCVVLTVGAFASGEPSGEPSGEGMEITSGEPSGEIASEEMTGESFTVTIRLNGDELRTVSVGVSVEGNVYTFDVSEFFAALGMELVYDEETDVAVIEAAPGSLMSVLLAQMESAEESATDDEVAAPETSGETVSAPEGQEPSGEPASWEIAEEASAAANVPARVNAARVLPDRQILKTMKESANLDRALLSLPSKDPT